MQTKRLTFFSFCRFAFIDLKKKPDKALKLNDSELGGLKLQVVMAKGRLEYRSYPNFHGCQRCGTYFHQRRFRKFYETHRYINLFLIIEILITK